VVSKRIASSVAVRRVETSDPEGTATTSGWGADNQKVTSVVADVGRTNVRPSSSRNRR
jgi:hypothetical protein